VDILARFPCRRHAPFENIRDVQLLADDATVLGLDAEQERRRPRRHFQRLDSRQRVQQFLGQTLGEIRLILLGAQVPESQHRDRRLILRGMEPPSASSEPPGATGGRQGQRHKRGRQRF
jgi:hypothetical protein